MHERVAVSHSHFISNNLVWTIITDEHDPHDIHQLYGLSGGRGFDFSVAPSYQTRYAMFLFQQNMPGKMVGCIVCRRSGESLTRDCRCQ